jgi:O-antigen ligase
MAQIQAAWRMVQDYPLTGVGPGNYTLAYEGGAGFAAQPYLLHPWYTSRGHAHNYYLHMAAEAGMVGALAYLLLLVALAWQAVAALRRAQSWWLRSISIGGCGIIATVAVHNLFENLHALNMGVQMGAVWGLLAALASQAGKETDGIMHE